MAIPPVKLPLPRPEMIERLSHATVTRGLIDRRGKLHLGAVYDSAGRLAAGSQRAPDRYRAGDPHQLGEALAGRAVERRLARALYLGHAFTHFGHFLLETVPALCWVREVDGDVPLLFHPFDERGQNVFTQCPHGVECLQMLGIPPDRIVMATGDFAVDELLMPPRPYDIQRGPRYDFRVVYRALRDGAQGVTPGPEARRIYLSRGRLKRRLRTRLANEAAIERRMAWRGFTVLHPERMSFADQIRAVASADVVAGVDGSALHLSAFMRPGARMLVLETSRRRTVLMLNALMEVETVSLPVDKPVSPDQPRKIDPGRLDAILERLGCPPAPGAIRRLADLLFR